MKKEVFRKVQGKQWYHQRFDGAPLYLFTIAEAEVKREKRKPEGTEADVRVSFFSKSGKGDWYLDMKDVRRGSEAVTERAKKDPNISAKLLRAWQKDETAFQEFFDRFDSIPLKKLSNKELIALFEKYYALMIPRFTSSSVIDHFALGTDEYIAGMLREEVGQIGRESDFTDIFSMATAPVHQSFINKAEMELLKIAIEHNPPQTPSPGLRPPSPLGRWEGEGQRGGRGSYDTRDDEGLTQALRKYQRKYFWIKNNYIDARVLNVEHFRREVEVWHKSGADLRAKYKQLRDTPKINARKKAALFKQYKFSRLLRTLLKVSEDFTWWQDQRKRATYLNIHMGTRILGEMARRRKVKPELTKYLTLPEAVPWFLTGVPRSGELEHRQKRCAYVVWRGGYEIVVGKRVDDLHKIMFAGKTNDKVDDLRGLTASVGRVTGRVKVVGSAREVGKVQKGDILVAVMTRPDYISGMRRAAAIVTNEGGITCHAAIISRELGIPCIIATKIATEVLKDGDLVEVNANHGVVRKI